MRGHSPILRMRLAGTRPRIVFINDFPTADAKDWHSPGEKYGQRWAADHATVQIDATDRIASLDLRFLAGVTVSASGSTESRAKELLEACKAAGAATVAATHVIFANPYRCESGWTEVWHQEAECLNS